MTDKKKRKIVSVKKDGGESKKDRAPQGEYFGDYRPRYQEAYSIYEKAKLHIKVEKEKFKKK